MNNKFFHGRVVIADRSTFFLLLLSVCFLAGALIGHRFAYTQAVCSDAGLQAYLASFFSLLERGDLPGAPFGASLISYCKYPVLIFVLGCFAPGRAFFPILFFYQGFCSFRLFIRRRGARHPPGLSSFRSALGVGAAVLLFPGGRRRIRTLTAAAPPPRGASRRAGGAVPRFSFCVLHPAAGRGRIF